MPTIRPFKALRPQKELAAKVCELPYDVLSSREAYEMAHNKPHSFFHVSKPEIDLDPLIDPCDPKVYAKGLENFKHLIEKNYLKQDSEPYLYLYRQVMGHHSQVGLVATASCQEYDQDIIKKHELTRPDKEDDRVRHIETLNSQTGPVFLTYQADPEIDQFIATKTFETSSVDFTGDDGVRHTAWVLSEKKDIDFLVQKFAKIPHFYIADGHHRSAAAVRVWKSRGSKPNASNAFFLSVIFPHNQMQILPYNRVVKDLNGLGLDRFVQQMRELGHFEIHAQPRPVKKHEICVFLDDVWNVFRWKEDLINQENAIGQLDVSLLQKHVLAPLLGIDDPRTSKKIQFVGGIRGTEELERLVRGGEWAVAFSMFPTSIQDLMTISNQGGIMPPKSTWFEPKLRDAMFCHMLD
jgi:uncharacterized protein (DUF1015 family)